MDPCCNTCCNSGAACQCNFDCLSQTLAGPCNNGYNPLIGTIRLPGQSPRPSFVSTISNVSAVSATTNPGFVNFFLRQIIVENCGTVFVLSWEPFTVTLNANGINSLIANGAIGTLPPWPIEQMLRIQLRGINRLGFVKVDPNSAAQITFYLDFSAAAVGNFGDIVNIPSQSVTWINS